MQKTKKKKDHLVSGSQFIHYTFLDNEETKPAATAKDSHPMGASSSPYSNNMFVGLQGSMPVTQPKFAWETQ